MANITIRNQMALLHRRAGLGLRPGELDAISAQGATAFGEIDRLITGAKGGSSTNSFPSVNVSKLDLFQKKVNVELTANSWIEQLVASNDPLGDRMTWLWHGHLVAGYDKVKNPQLMIPYISLLRTHAVGNFRNLLRALTTDAAMLVYLDGEKNRGKAPNENYSREVLELFTLGLNYNGQPTFTEADVTAGAKALSGWTAGKYSTKVAFEPKRHENAPQAYLGRQVHDVDTVIDAILAHKGCAQFVTQRVAKALFGSAVDVGLVTAAADQFRSSGYDISTMLTVLLRGAVTTPSPRFVGAPVPWLVSLRRATGATLAPAAQAVHLAAAGQLPLDPPNVSGWPSGNSWLAAGTVIERSNLAGLLATSTPASSVVTVAAARSDWQQLADGLGRPEGFSAAEISVLAGRANVTERLMLAFASPTMVEI